MIAVDTNILIYARDPRDHRKQEIALDLLARISNGALLWQVACEYLAAGRKLESFGFTIMDAVTDLNDLLRLWTPVLPHWNNLSRAAELVQQHGMSSWDALILASCEQGHITELVSENFGGGQVVQGLNIVNPFT